MSRTSILVVEDEPAVRELLVATLEAAGYAVLEAADTQQAREQLSATDPGLILLDWMLPGMSGLDFTRWLKRDKSLETLPIIMLTARDAEAAKIQGLEAGVDDYVTKPFSTRELLARIKAVLRRSGGDPGELIALENGLVMDLLQHQVTADRVPVPLGPTEFKLLQFFMAHQDRVYSRGQLLDQVWGRNVYIEERTVDVHIRRLRKALEPFAHDKLVQTVRGVGYRFSVQGA